MMNRLLHSAAFAVGSALLLLILIAALVAPPLFPGDPLAIAGPPMLPPSPMRLFPSEPTGLAATSSPNSSTGRAPRSSWAWPLPERRSSSAVLWGLRRDFLALWPTRC